MDRLQSRWGRVLAHLQAWFIDHEVIRVIYRNFHPLSKQAWRSNQPSPGFVRKLHRRFRVRTILNLRGANKTGHYLLQKEACDHYGITLINFPISSRRLPSKEQVHGLVTIFKTAEYPLVLHCKSGADRAGLASVLYRLVVLDHPIEEAIKELHFLYGHFRWADTGKLDFFFDAFRLAKQENPELTFLHWLDHHYNPETLDSQFKSQGWAKVLVNLILRRE